jgi:threonine synthase
MWKRKRLLPVVDELNIVSLGEQITPIIRLLNYRSTIGVDDVWVKDEGQLPTGSFKARGLALAISKAKEFGVETICIPSAGNAASAASAYAAKAGIEARIYMPEETPAVNIAECKAYGAQVELVKGNISDAAKRMNEARRSHPEWFDVSTLKEPYRLEGKKTMGFELAEQFDWRLPDVVVYPTGGGTGLIGMWKAFDEMEQLGWIDSKRPRMVSVQSAGCAPIVRAFEERKADSVFWENAATIAAGLRVPKAFADHLILKAIYESNGSAVSVTDDEIRAAVLEIARREGLFISPEGAATFVAAEQLRKSRFIKQTDRVILFNTATGIKYTELVA